jgi:hypothetical protein
LLDRSPSQRKPQVTAGVRSLTIVFDCLALLANQGPSFESLRVRSIYFNGRIYQLTLRDLRVRGSSEDGDAATATDCLEAIAIPDDNIAAIGPTEEILTRYGSEDSGVIHLDGHLVMAGFKDAHVRLESAGDEKLTIDLVGVQSLPGRQQRIANAACAIRRERRFLATSLRCLNTSASAWVAIMK